MASKIADFAAAQANFNTRQGAAIAQLGTSVAGVTTDVQALKDKVLELQHSAGTVTPEDQALLDDLQLKAESATARLETVSNQVKALDDATPPVVPVVLPGA